MRLQIVERNPEEEIKKAKVLKEVMRDNIKPCDPSDWAEREDRAMLGRIGGGWRRMAQF